MTNDLNEKGLHNLQERVKQLEAEVAELVPALPAPVRASSASGRARADPPGARRPFVWSGWQVELKFRESAHRGPRIAGLLPARAATIPPLARSTHPPKSR